MWKFFVCIFQKFDTEELSRTVTSFIYSFIHSCIHSRLFLKLQESCNSWTYVWILNSFQEQGVCTFVWLSCNPTIHSICRFDELSFRLPTHKTLGKRNDDTHMYLLSSIFFFWLCLFFFSSLLSSLHIVGNLTCSCPLIRIFCIWSFLKFCDNFLFWILMVDHVFQKQFRHFGFHFCECWTWNHFAVWIQGVVGQMKTCEFPCFLNRDVKWYQVPMTINLCFWFVCFGQSKWCLQALDL